MKLISRNAHAFKWIYQETGLYVNVLHEMPSFTDLLQSGEKPVPFWNRYYFPTLIFPMTHPTKPIKVPAIKPSIPVTDSSPTDEVHTPTQSQPKVTISLTHTLTHTQTDRQTDIQLVTMVTRYLFYHCRQAINQDERSPLK